MVCGSKCDKWFEYLHIHWQTILINLRSTLTQGHNNFTNGNDKLPIIHSNHGRLFLILEFTLSFNNITTYLNLNSMVYPLPWFGITFAFRWNTMGKCLLPFFWTMIYLQKLYDMIAFMYFCLHEQRSNITRWLETL